MTTLRERGLVAIEVGLNETATKERNPSVPYGPDEVAAEACAAGAAGAAVVHFHARADDGSQQWTSDDIYRRAMSAIARSGSDVLSYPSYLEGDLSHVWALTEDPPLGPGLCFAPFDVVQHVKRVQWNHAERRFEGLTALGATRDRPVVPPELDRFRSLGLVASIGAFELGEVRWSVLAARSGVLPEPLCIKVFLNGTWVRGPGADRAGLDAFLSQVPDDIDAEVTVVPYEMPDAESCLALLDAALERGHHVRVGVGDNPGAFPAATSGELVGRAVELAERHGLRPATPADVLDRFAAAGSRAVRG